MKYAWILAAALAGLAPVAMASDAQITKLDGRVQLMEQSVRDLQAATRQQGLDVATKMAAVDEVLANWNGFKGEVDAMNQQMQLLLDQLKKFIDEFDARVQAIEKKVAVDTTTGPVPTEAIAKNTAAEALYHEGLNAVRERDYPTALSAFSQFVQAVPKHPLSAGAQLWIGECQYALGEFQTAVTEYQRVIERYPNSDKVPTALYKQGMAFAELGMNDEATRYFKQLIAQVPNSREAKRAASRLQLLQTGDTATAVRH